MLITMISSISAFAADGSSGCGPGWFVFKDTSLISSALRATTNGILFPTTTIGMTLGTSNCSKHNIVLKEKEIIHYALNNFYEIQSEAAQGNGEYLNAFAQVVGCQNNEAFNSKLKENFEKVFKYDHQQTEDMVIEVYKVILTDSILSQSCTLV